MRKVQGPQPPRRHRHPATASRSRIDSDKELLQIKVAVEDAKTRLMQMEMDGR